jgi:hypothetical protein
VINLRSGALRFLLIAVGALLVYALGIFVRHRYGIRVEIRNESGEMVRQVSVKVEGVGGRGTSYALRDLAPTARARVYVQPLTESDISFTFADAKGNVHVNTPVGYAEAGYCGTATSTISSEKKIESTSTLGCWKSWLDFI